MEQEITLVEITDKELQSLMLARERQAKEQIIEHKTQEIVNLIKDINALGGKVRVNHSHKNRYFSVGGATLKPKAYISGSNVEFQI